MYSSFEPDLSCVPLVRNRVLTELVSSCFEDGHGLEQSMESRVLPAFLHKSDILARREIARSAGLIVEPLESGYFCGLAE